MEPPNVKYMSTGITRSHISGQLLLDLAAVRTSPTGLSPTILVITLIQEGINDLTSKLTCLGSPSNPLAMNKWYSINVTGVNSQGSDAVQLPLPIQPSIQNGKTNL